MTFKNDCDRICEVLLIIISALLSGGSVWLIGNVTQPTTIGGSVGLLILLLVFGRIFYCVLDKFLEG